LISGAFTTEVTSMLTNSIGSGLAFRHFLRCLFFLICFSNVAVADVSFVPRIATGVSYTDNVFLEPVDEEYDYITYVTPGFDLSLTGRHSGLGLTYDPTYVNHTRFPERTYWRQSASLDGWAEIARDTRLELTNTALYTEESSETDTTARQGGEPYFTNTATVGVVNRFGAEDLFDLRYVYYILENEDASIEDSAYHQPTLLMTYWFSPNRYAIEMEGRYTISDFEVSEDFEDVDARFRLTKRFGRHLDGYIEYGHVYFDYLDDGEDYRVYSPLVGFTWEERADTRFAASFGYFYRDNAISEDDDGIVGSVETAYDYATDGSISVNGSVGYDRAFFGAENLGFNPYYEVAGNITHLLSRRLTGSLVAGYRRNVYIDETPDREDALWRAGVGLAYQALSWLTFNLDYDYRQLNSNVDTNDYTENRGTISVTLTPRQPIRF